MSIKISDLTSHANADGSDVLPIVDVSVPETKKITVDNLKESLELDEVDNTSDLDKPISTATQTALDDKLEAADIADFETSTQLNSRDTANRDRANHTGTQAISTVSGLQDALDDKADANALGALAFLDDVDTGEIQNQAVTNQKLENMNANTVKGRLSGNGTPQDIALADLPISSATQAALDDKLESSDIADFETTTQLNDRDTANRDRANHTGTQAISTITGLQDELDDKQDEITLTADRAVITDGAGKLFAVSGVTGGDVSALSGVTSNIQSQLNNIVATTETTTQLNSRDTANRDRANHTGTQNINTIDGGGGFNFAGFDSTGTLIGLGGYQHNSSPAGGLNFNRIIVPEDTNNFRQQHQIYSNYNPTVSDAEETWQHFVLEANIGDDNSGNQLGNPTDPGGIIALAVRGSSRQSSSFGLISLIRGDTQIGSSSESAAGNSFEGTQLNLNLASESSLNSVNFFVASISSSNDSEIAQNLNLYNSFGQAPNNLGNFTGFSTNVNHRDFVFGTAFGDFTQHTGTAQGYTGLQISPSLDTITNNVTAINVNPTVNACQNYQGIVVNTNNVNVFPGVQASVVIQDLTYTAVNPGADANNLQIEYVGGGTAGSEGVTLAGNTLTVEIEDGVSTATQIKNAVDSSPAIIFVSVAISGTGSNTQNTVSPTNLAGGENPGQSLAAQFNGDVQVNGALQFSGALSVGALNAFASQPAIDGGGQPQSIHSLITNVTVADDAVLTTADTIGVNTACLIQIGEDASVSTAFLGIAALGLPAVVTMLSGSTVDRIAGGLFALSLDVGGTGGTINELALCKSVALPNGVTTVTNVYGFDYTAPFGTFGFVNIYPFHSVDNFNSYFRGGLVVGEDQKTRTNSSVLLEIASATGAFLNARMTTTERDALTVVDGMQIYNTTDSKLQVRAGGSWVDLH